MRLSVVLSAFVGLFSTTVAIAQSCGNACTSAVTVDVFHGGTCTRACASANSAITITIPSDTTFVRVFSTSTLVDLGTITFATSGSLPSSFDFLIESTSALNQDETQDLTSGAHNWLGGWAGQG